MPKRYPPLEKMEQATHCIFNLDYGLTYQTCRFCGKGWRELTGLWKYGVRHYICQECREAAIRKAKGE